MDYEAIQSINFLLATLTIDELHAAFQKGFFHTRQFTRNAVIHFEAEPCTKLEVVLEGTVFIERLDADGNTMTVEVFSVGDILGGNLMFSSNPEYLMNVIAKEQACLLEISADSLFHLLSHNTVFLKEYLKVTANRTLVLGNKIKYTVRKTIRENILYFLAMEYRKQKTKKLKLPWTKTELAARMGVQRSSLSRELARMQDEGLIGFDAKSIEIKSLSFDR